MRCIGYLLLCCLALLVAVPTLAQDRGKTIRVATKPAAPFAFKDAAGQWRGISIELIYELADDLSLKVELVEDTLDGMLAGVADGKYDAAIAAISITPEREAKLDFTYPYFSTGLGIAVKQDGGSGWLQVARRFFTVDFLAAVGSLAAILLVAGILVWLFERRRNPEQFAKGPVKGIGDGFWWAAVTMTTVGYGDKAPRTLGGRVVGVLWMFTTIIIIASFTAAITSSLTVGQLAGRVRSADDLPHVTVGALADTTAADALAGLNVRPRLLASVEAGFQALLDDRIDAFVHDRPLLQYVAFQTYPGKVRILQDPIDKQDYGIALPTGSPLREPLNRALLARIHARPWRDTIARYLGND